MKKILFSIIMFILVLPVVVFADNEAEIKSIEFIEKSEGTTVVNEASTDGVKVNLDLVFHDVDDYASYKIILKNNTGTSLYINDDIFNSSKEYIKYNFIYEDGKNIIKSGEEKEVTLKVTYADSVPKNLYRNAEYDASSDDPLILSDKLINLPNTLKNIGILGIAVLIISSACILMGVYVVLKNNKKSTINTLLLLLLLLLIPKGASALLKYEIPIDSKILIKASKENPCTFEGNLVQGAQFVNGQYTYRYMQRKTYNSWANVTLDGWGVALTDNTSTDAVTSKLCTSINDKPIVYMDYMFYYSKAESIDLSSFDTSNVVSMNYMFYYVKNVEELDLSSFDTRNVTTINYMFYGLDKLKELDIIGFDLSSVTGSDNFIRDLTAAKKIVLPHVMPSSYSVYLPNIYADENNVRYFYFSKYTDPDMNGKTLIYVDDLYLFNNGGSVNAKMKTLAGGAENIKEFKMSTEQPSDEIMSNSNNNVSYFSYGPKVVMWYESGTIYYYSNNHKVYLSDYASSFFSGLTNIEYIELDNIDASLVKEITYFFSNCGYNSTSIRISGIDSFEFTKDVKANNMFAYVGYNSNSINIENLKDFDVSNIVEADDMFTYFGNKAREINLDLSGWHFAKLKKLNYIFEHLGYECQKITIDCSDWKIDVATEMRQVFFSVGYGGKEIDINVTGWTFPNVTTTYAFFETCGYAAQKVNVYGFEEWDVSNIKDFYGFFFNMSRSAEKFEVDISKWDFSNATNISYLMKYSGERSNEVNVNISNMNLKEGVSAYMPFSMMGESAKKVTVTAKNITFNGQPTYINFFDRVGRKATQSCKIDFSGSDVTKITSLSGLFESACGGGTAEIDITGIDTSNITSMYSMFYAVGQNASSLTINGLQDLNTEKVTNMNYMFYLTSHINLDDFHIYNDASMPLAFSGTKNVNMNITIHKAQSYYSDVFKDAALISGDRIKVNYTSEVDNIDDIIATKSEGSNVVKGDLIDS